MNAFYLCTNSKQMQNNCNAFFKIVLFEILDGGGQIDDDEMYGVVVTLFKMMNKEVEDEELDDIVDDILEKVDANGDGVISEAEFIHHAMKSSFLADLVNNHTG